MPAVGDVVAAFRGDTGALCGLGKVMDDSGTLTLVCYAPKGVTLSFKVWLSESGIEEPVVVTCDNASKLVAPESRASYEGHAISGSTEDVFVGFDGLSDVPLPAGVACAKGGIEVEARMPGGVKSVAVSKLPTGMKFDAKNGNVIKGVPTKPGEYVVQVKVTSNAGVVETRDVKVVIAALTVTLKADGAVSVTGKLPNGVDVKGKAMTLSVSASGAANVGGLREGAIIADFAPVVTVNKAKKVLSIKTNLWFDRRDDHAEGVGEARFVE